MVEHKLFRICKNFIFDYALGYLLLFYVLHHQPILFVLFPLFLVTFTVPSRSVPLTVSQQDFDVVLTWGEIPLDDRRGFILGYNVYIGHGSQPSLIGKL